MAAETYTITSANVTVNLAELGDLLIEHMAPKMSGQWHEDNLRDFCVQVLEPVMEDRIDRRVTEFMESEANDLVTRRDAEDIAWESTSEYINQELDFADIVYASLDMYDLADRVAENLDPSDLIDMAELDDTYCRLSTFERDTGLIIDQLEQQRERITQLEQARLSARVKRGLFTLTGPFRYVGNKIVSLRNIRLTLKESN